MNAAAKIVYNLKWLTLSVLRSSGQYLCPYSQIDSVDNYFYDLAARNSIDVGEFLGRCLGGLTASHGVPAASLHLAGHRETHLSSFHNPSPLPWNYGPLIELYNTVHIVRFFVLLSAQMNGNWIPFHFERAPKLYFLQIFYTLAPTKTTQPPLPQPGYWLFL